MRKHRHWEYDQAKYVKNGQTDTIRLNWILLNVLEGQRFGGDLAEMREGIDAEMSWEENPPTLHTVGGCTDGALHMWAIVRDNGSSLDLHCTTCGRDSTTRLNRAEWMRWHGDISTESATTPAGKNDAK